MGVIFTVPQGHCVIVERIGKANRVNYAGLRFRLPFLERTRDVSRDWGDVANKNKIFIELTEQQTDTKARQAQTKDNVTLQTLDAVVYWKITDPMKALYEVDHLPDSVRDTALNALRSRIGQRTLDELLAERQTLNEEIAGDLADTMSRWGVRLTRVDIQEIKYDESTAEAMRQQMQAERKARAVVLEAEGLAKAKIMMAKATKEAAVIQAEGQAEALAIQAKAETDYLRAVHGVVSASHASSLLIAQKYIDGFRVITENSGDGDKIYLPSSSSGLAILDAVNES